MQNLNKKTDIYYKGIAISTFNTLFSTITEKETAQLQTKLNETTDKIKTLEKGVDQAKERIELQKENLERLDVKSFIIGQYVLFVFFFVNKNVSEALSNDLY